MRTVVRYLGGAVLIVSMIVAGVVLRIVQIGGSDSRAAADAIVALGAARSSGAGSTVL